MSSMDAEGAIVILVGKLFTGFKTGNLAFGYKTNSYGLITDTRSHTQSAGARTHVTTPARWSPTVRYCRAELCLSSTSPGRPYRRNCARSSCRLYKCNVRAPDRVATVSRN